MILKATTIMDGEDFKNCFKKKDKIINLGEVMMIILKIKRKRNSMEILIVNLII